MRPRSKLNEVKKKELSKNNHRVLNELTLEVTLDVRDLLFAINNHLATANSFLPLHLSQSDQVLRDLAEKHPEWLDQYQEESQPAASTDEEPAASTDEVPDPPSG